ncbi:unnamed protein product [Aspergillus oryzae]|nr:unnamed protein product [Aspergillus oryzae]
MSTILEGITMFVHVSTQSVGAVAFNPVLTDSGSKLTISHLFHNRGGCISFLALIQYEISNSLWHSVLTRLSGLAAGLAHFQLDRACSATHHNASVALTWGFMASPGEGWVALNGSDTITCWARHGLGLTSWTRVAYTTTADSYPWIRYTEP